LSRKLLTLLFVLLLLAGVAPRAGAQTLGPVKLGIAPVDANGSYFDLTMEPGEQRELTVRLTNFGDHDARAQTYAADAYTLVNGGFGAKLADELTSGATTWLDYPSEVLQLKAGAAVDRQFTVSVPADAAPGEHLTSLVVQNADPIKGSGSVAINQVNRQALAVLITVPGPVTAKLRATSATYKLAPTAASVLVAITNDGNVRLKPAGEVVIATETGAEVARAKIAMGSVYAGTDTEIEVALSQPLPSGDYVVTVALSDAKTKLVVKADALPMTVTDAAADASPAATPATPTP
jgi:uncharacterized membrane protein